MQAPQAVVDAISGYVADLSEYFTAHGIGFTVTCDVAAATSVDDRIWETGVDSEQTMFVGSAVKTFILADFLRQDLPENALVNIDDSVRSLSSTVYGDQTLSPDFELNGQTLMRNVLEAMISHSDNTATDVTLKAAGPDNVRQMISALGLDSVKIPESTRRLFTYLASGQNVDVDWQTVLQYAEAPPDPQPAINDVQSMLASAADMVRWYETALLDPTFFTPAQLAEFERISGMADALHTIVPDGLASYGKGGSITWNNFGCLSVSGQMVVPTRDPALPWVPVTFSFNVNWDREDQKTFGQVLAILQHTASDVLAASQEALFPTITEFTLTVSVDDLTGTSGRDDFSGPGGGIDSLHGLAGNDTFHIDGDQTGVLSGGDGYDTVIALADRLKAGLALDTVEELDARTTRLHARLAQLAEFSTIVAKPGSDELQLVLHGAGGTLDFSSRFVSPVLLEVDAAAAGSAVVLAGTANDDGLAGSAFDDSLLGGEGDDLLRGGAGSDALYGEHGDDVLAGGAAGDAPNQLWGGTGSDTASYAGTAGTVYADLAWGGAMVDGVLVDTMDSIENLTGGLGTNTLVGNGADNLLRGGDSTDYLYGQAGNDTLIGGAASDGGPNQLWGGQGSDTASYVGTSGAVHADLGAAAGFVDGVLVDQMSSIENLVGSAQADILAGDGGANVLAGGEGGDQLWGRGGADVFAYAGYADSNLVTGYDTIGDFVTGVSTLDLTALHTSAAHVLIQSSATSTSLYVERVAGSFNAATDLAIAFAGPGAIAMGDVRF